MWVFMCIFFQIIVFVDLQLPGTKLICTTSFSSPKLHKDIYICKGLNKLPQTRLTTNLRNIIKVILEFFLVSFFSLPVVSTSKYLLKFNPVDANSLAEDINSRFD